MNKKLKDIIEILKQVNATDIKVYDYENTSPFFDYVIVGTATDRQGNAAVGYLKKADLVEMKNVEGRQNSGWVLIDASDVIIHLFTSEMRKVYNFDERLMLIKQIEIE